MKVTFSWLSFEIKLPLQWQMLMLQGQGIFHVNFDNTEFGIQGPPYLLARYKTESLSKCVDDFQKNISLRQGSGSSECSCLMFFQI